VVLAVNKIDLVNFSQRLFDDIVRELRKFARDLGCVTLVPIPISARFGDDVIEKNANTSWYGDVPLLAHLESVDIETALVEKPFRIPVQWVNRPNLDFRGFSGTIVAAA
jgi:bifunctional enzyme CysN/CysC